MFLCGLIFGEKTRLNTVKTKPCKVIRKLQRRIR